MRQTWVTPGGVHPPENKHQSVTQPIGSLPIPEKLVVPLGQHIGAPAIACVKLGDKVLKGQKNCRSCRYSVCCDSCAYLWHSFCD